MAPSNGHISDNLHPILERNTLNKSKILDRILDRFSINLH